MTTTTTGLGTSAIDSFLHAAQSAAIPACTAWAADATLDATVPNWRKMRLTGADAAAGGRTYRGTAHHRAGAGPPQRLCRAAPPTRIPPGQIFLRVS